MWINTLRAQRRILKKLREKKALTQENYRTLYAKAKGNYFRDIRRMIGYAKEQGMLK